MIVNHKPVILSVAPQPKKSAGINFDYTPEYIAEEVVACARAGAAEAHLHVLDSSGCETTNLAVFDRTLELIRQKSDIILQGSTGGSPTQPLHERSVSLENSFVQTASLNMGSVNFGDAVYINPVPEVKAFAERMRQRRISAEMEIFDLSMLYVSMDFAANKLAPPHFNLCFGFENAMPAKESVLRFFLSELSGLETALIGVLHTGSKTMDFLRLALELGVDIVRVGFEDSTLHAVSNAALVEKLAELAVSAGRRVASITEAKERMGL